MKIGIVGSREFKNYSLMKEKYLEITKDMKVDAIVSGGAKGADFLAERLAEELEVNMIIYPAEWKKFGKAAGMIRNTTIVENSDIIIAFPIGSSVGTWDTIRKAKGLFKPVYIF